MKFPQILILEDVIDLVGSSIRIGLEVTCEVGYRDLSNDSKTSVS